jgi:hypothetical protein
LLLLLEMLPVSDVASLVQALAALSPAQQQEMFHLVAFRTTPPAGITASSTIFHLVASAPRPNPLRRFLRRVLSPLSPLRLFLHRVRLLPLCLLRCRSHVPMFYSVTVCLRLCASSCTQTRLMALSSFVISLVREHGGVESRR